jgi:hypothetical protein
MQYNFERSYRTTGCFAVAPYVLKPIISLSIGRNQLEKEWKMWENPTVLSGESSMGMILKGDAFLSQNAAVVLN